MKLEVKELNYSYSGENEPVLKGMNLSVSEGEFVTLLGPSGCGKSTFLNVLAGILKGYEGSILIDGEEVCGINSHFAYMPQNDLLLPWKTILDNVCLYGELHHTKKQMAKEARKRMSDFGLEGCEDKYPYELSGGMRQRAAFLRTTFCSADIYLLDEPFGALDVITREQLQDWLLGLCRTLNKTIILVTHDTDEAIYLSDRIFILGRKGEGIRSCIEIPDRERSRKWLFSQGSLRTEIHNIISDKQP